MRNADDIHHAALAIEHEAGRLKHHTDPSVSRAAWVIADRARDLLRLADRVAAFERERGG